VLVHVAAAYLLVFGLAAPPFIAPPIQDTKSYFIDATPDIPDPVDPPEQVSTEVPPDSIVWTPLDQALRTRDTPQIVTTTSETTTPTVILVPTIPRIDPIPALPDPIRPRPIGNPGNWATTDHYPPISIRRNEEGVSRFTVTVGTNGRVSDCRITTSSGHDRLDQAACRAITNNGRFEPAKNQYGEMVQGTYSNAVNWRLPSR
jgi:protein TonB